MALPIYTKSPQDGSKELLTCLTCSGTACKPMLFPGFIAHQNPMPTPKAPTVI